MLGWILSEVLARTWEALVCSAWPSPGNPTWQAYLCAFTFAWAVQTRFTSFVSWPWMCKQTLIRSCCVRASQHGARPWIRWLTNEVAALVLFSYEVTCALKSTYPWTNKNKILRREDLKDRCIVLGSVRACFRHCQSSYFSEYRSTAPTLCLLNDGWFVCGLYNI